MAWLLDLDGVMWLGDQPIYGAADAVARLRSNGQRVVFLTNNSSLTVNDYVAKLRAMGVPAEEADVITSAQAAAAMMTPSSTALVCAGKGVEEALQRRGVRTVRSGRADAVVVGWHREFDFDRLTSAYRAVAAGARLIGTNDDATYPMPTGMVPGGGSILAAVSYATGQPAEVAGKPFKAMVGLVKERVGRVDAVVGDRASTDGALARNLGARFTLVLSGVTSQEDLPVEPAPDLVVADLAAAVTTGSPPPAS
jgi:HAD superfamily hydrolase (TIGR01450 family)